MIQFKSLQEVSPQNIQELANNPKIAKNLKSGFPSPYSIEDAILFKDLVEQGKLGTVFALYLEATFVGCASIFEDHEQGCEIGIWIGEPFWNQGIASKAIPFLLNHALESGYRSIYAFVKEQNASSMHVFLKSGFKVVSKQKDLYELKYLCHEK